MGEWPYENMEYGTQENRGMKTWYTYVERRYEDWENGLFNLYVDGCIGLGSETKRNWEN